MYVRGKNSTLFYFLSRVAKPLSMLSVVPEMFHQCDKVIPLFVGNEINGSYIGEQLKAGLSEEAIIANIRGVSLDLDQ